jgi:hypothetical protein
LMAAPQSPAYERAKAQPGFDRLHRGRIQPSLSMRLLAIRRSSVSNPSVMMTLWAGFPNSDNVLVPGLKVRVTSRVAE